MNKPFKHFLDYRVRDTAVGLFKISIHSGLRLLSIDGCSAFGAMLAANAAKRHAGADRRARRNWRMLRPEASDPASEDAAMRRLWRSVCRTMSEFAVLHRLWDAGRISVTGVEHLDAAREAGKPILMACVHLGNWEVLPLVSVRNGHRCAGIYLPLPDRFETHIAVKARERYGITLYPADGPRAMRAAIAELQARNGPLVIFIDDYARGRVHAPFFGRSPRPDGNIAYAARLAVRTGAEIIPAYAVRLDDSARFHVTFLPPVPLERVNTAEALARNMAAANAVIEPIIRDHLDQWFYGLEFEFD